MTLSQALALGVLQGGTEFLPISSSGHLVLAQNLMPGLAGPLLLFDVVVHLGTLFAIALMLRARVAALLRAAVSFLPGTRVEASPTDRRWVILIAIGSLPTAFLGLLLRGAAEALLEQPAGVGAALLVTALLLLLSERLGRRSRAAPELGVLDALACGLAQGLAVLPGISRSGATVAAALWRDVRGEVAVEFSLLLSMPAVAGAALLVALQGAGEVQLSHLAPLGVGFAAALVSGILALKALVWAVTRRRLLPFALYCATVGVGALILG